MIVNRTVTDRRRSRMTASHDAFATAADDLGLAAAAVAVLPDGVVNPDEARLLAAEEGVYAVRLQGDRKLNRAVGRLNGMVATLPKLIVRVEDADARVTHEHDCVEVIRSSIPVRDRHAVVGAWAWLALTLVAFLALTEMQAFGSTIAKLLDLDASGFGLWVLGSLALAPVVSAHYAGHYARLSFETRRSREEADRHSAARLAAVAGVLGALTVAAVVFVAQARQGVGALGGGAGSARVGGGTQGGSTSLASLLVVSLMPAVAAAVLAFIQGSPEMIALRDHRRVRYYWEAIARFNGIRVAGQKVRLARIAARTDRISWGMRDEAALQVTAAYRDIAHARSARPGTFGVGPLEKPTFEQWCAARGISMPKAKSIEVIQKELADEVEALRRREGTRSGRFSEQLTLFEIAREL